MHSVSRHIHYVNNWTPSTSCQLDYDGVNVMIDDFWRCLAGGHLEIDFAHWPEVHQSGVTNINSTGGSGHDLWQLCSIRPVIYFEGAIRFLKVVFDKLSLSPDLPPALLISSLPRHVSDFRQDVNCVKCRLLWVA